VIAAYDKSIFDGFQKLHLERLGNIIVLSACLTGGLVGAIGFGDHSRRGGGRMPRMKTRVDRCNERHGVRQKSILKSWHDRAEIPKSAATKKSWDGGSVGVELALALAQSQSIEFTHNLGKACEGKGRSSGRFGHIKIEAEAISW
jgi:hypothetical protein